MPLGLGCGDQLSQCSFSLRRRHLFALAEIFDLPNDCELVHMYPNYLPLPPPPGQSDGRYRLFYYAEGYSPAPAELRPGESPSGLFGCVI